MSRKRNKNNKKIESKDDITIIDFDIEEPKIEESKIEELKEEVKEEIKEEIKIKETETEESKDDEPKTDEDSKPEEEPKSEEEPKTDEESKPDEEPKPEDSKESESKEESDNKDSDKEESDVDSKSETESETDSESEKKPKSRILKYIGRFFAFVGVTLVMIIIGLYVVMWICTKGPSSQIKELFVLSVRESSAGGFLADIYLSKEEIAAIEAKNSVEEVTSVTDTSIVQIATKPEGSASDNSANEQVEEGFIAESMYDVNVYNENGIEFHEIAGTTFTGIAMVVKDPSRVFIGTPRDTYDGGPGISVPDIADRYGAIAATNGGFFVDTGGHGDGGTPIGAVFSHGKMVYGSSGAYYNIMGFNEEGVLICGNMSGQQAIDLGIRDGLQCNPFLIINGEPINVGGKGGGLNPRTALGQRADGAVVLLVIDGRQASSLGASMSDMVDVMLSFSVVNAGNLDGGGSTVLYYNGEIQNVVMSIYGARGVPNAVCVSPE